LSEGAASGLVIVKALPMLMPESVVQQSAEKKRVKKGILGGSEEIYSRCLLHNLEAYLS